MLSYAPVSSGTVDIAQAVLDDPRLPVAHRERRLPQLYRQLIAERERLTGRALSQDSPPPSLRRLHERSYYREVEGPDEGLEL